MSDDFDVNVTGLRELIADLDRHTSKALPETIAIVKKGAQNIKEDWRKRWSGLAHAPHLPNAIGYDEYRLPGSARATIGPDKDRKQGALGNLIEFGSVNNAPIPGGAPALRAEEPRFLEQLASLAERTAGG